MKNFHLELKIENKEKKLEQIIEVQVSKIPLPLKLPEFLIRNIKNWIIEKKISCDLHCTYHPTIVGQFANNECERGNDMIKSKCILASAFQHINTLTC